MAKRRGALCVVMAGILLAGAVPAMAGETVVYPGYPGEYEAFVGDDLVMGTSRIAATKGQVRVFLGHPTGRYELWDSDGTLVWQMSAGDSALYWGPLERFNEEDILLDCPMPTMWASWWTYSVPVEPDEVGTHQLVYTGTYEQRVNDGLHACIDLAPPGMFPPIPTPSLYRCTVVVESTIDVKQWALRAVRDRTAGGGGGGRPRAARGDRCAECRAQGAPG